MTKITSIATTLGKYLSFQNAPLQERLTLEDVVAGFNGISRISEHQDFEKNYNRQLTKLIVNNNKKILRILETNELRSAITIRSGVTLRECANSRGGTDIEVSVDGYSSLLRDINLKNLKERLTFDQFAHPDIYKVTRQSFHTDWSGVNLSGMDLRRADLKRVNLGGANLSRAILIGAKLNGACLNRVNLSEADLNGANLSESLLVEANLNETCLHSANLKNANLWRASFKEANLRVANLNRANLHEANLSKALLIGANLSRTNLSGANLSEANLNESLLIEANLNATNLFKSYLIGCYLHGANLINANLMEADLSGANSTKADFSGADLRKAVLIEADLNESSLIGADLSGSELRSANLSNTHLSNAAMESVGLVKARLTDAVFTSTTPTLRFPENWDDRTVDRYFNHNANSSSLLSTINSISDHFMATKIDLVRQTCIELTSRGVNLHLVRENFLVLTKSLYLDDPTIALFCEHQVIKPLIEHANMHPWLNKEASVCDALLSYIESHNSFDLIKNNGFFIQLILNSLNLKDANVVTKARQLYENKYLSMAIMQQVISLEDFGDHGEHRVDWSDHYSLNFVLINDDLIMMTSVSQLTAMLNGKSQNSNAMVTWDHFFLFKITESGALYDQPRPSNVGSFFKNRFKIFYDPYAHNITENRFYLILDLLNLGTYHKNFMYALNTKKFNKKLTHFNQQVALTEIFEKHLDIDKSEDRAASINLKEMHYQAILNTYNLTTDTSANEQARFLFCLATVFVNYTSSAILGTEYDSPEAVRHYAYALMKKAEELSPGICKAKFEDRKNRLLGLNKAFTCTSVLFEEMRQSAQEHASDYIGMLLPPAWR